MSRIHSATDTREADALVKRAMHPVRRLSYFERQQAQALGKTLDAYGNLDLNDGANQITQSGPVRRVNPNVKTSATYSDDSSASHDSGESACVQEALDETTKIKKVRARDIVIKSLCARNCQKDGKNVQGRSRCEYCLGEGFIAKQARLEQDSTPHRELYQRAKKQNSNWRYAKES